MQFLQVLETIRWITGQRGSDHFPRKAGAVEAIGLLGTGQGVLFVYNPTLARQILRSPQFGQHNFLASAMALAGAQQTGWIRRFCAESPLMLEGPLHEQRRGELASVFERCSGTLAELGPDGLASTLKSDLGRPGASSLRVAEGLTTALINHCLSAVSQRRVALTTDELMAVDFFNPFPKPSTLRRCNKAIATCMAALDWERLCADERTAAAALMVMGAAPLVAAVTASLNALLESLSATPGNIDQAVAACSRMTFQRIVPTNFVMRRCLTTTTLAGHSLVEGDRLYVFLGAATGCPFSKISSLPFGAGRHSCSGLALALQMLAMAQRALAAEAQRIATAPVLLHRSAVAQGGASAFLAYADRQSVHQQAIH